MLNGRPDNVRKIKLYANINADKYNIINTLNGMLAKLRCVQYFIFYSCKWKMFFLNSQPVYFSKRLFYLFIVLAFD